MKNPALILSTGLLALVLFSACGNGDRQRQEEAIRDLEESFALDSGEESSSNQTQTTSGGGGSSQPRTSTRDTSTNTSSPARDTSQTTNTAGSGSTQDSSGGEREVDPVVQEVARETVQMMQNRQYDTAVENLDQLMNSPGLTPAQRSATRRTMAEVQQQIIRDPNISDAEKERIKQVLQRQ